MDQITVAMTGAELQITRDYLGISREWLSNEMVMNERRMGRMEAGKEPIPQALVTKLDEMYAEAKDVVERQVATYRRKMKATDADVVLRTYRTDSQYEQAGYPEASGKYPSQWHRMIVARVADAVPGLIVTHYDAPDKGPDSKDEVQTMMDAALDHAFVSFNNVSRARLSFKDPRLDLAHLKLREARRLLAELTD
jgi:hypothetical protein